MPLVEQEPLRTHFWKSGDLQGCGFCLQLHLLCGDRLLGWGARQRKGIGNGGTFEAGWRQTNGHTRPPVLEFVDPGSSKFGHVLARR